MDWIVLDEVKILADFPTDLKVRYDSWIIDYPDKGLRLTDVTASYVAQVRDSIRSEPSNVLDPDENMIPLSAVQACETLIIGTIAMEMGVELSPEATQMMTRADLFIRQIAYGHMKTTATAAEAVSPTYVVPPRSSSMRPLPAILCLLLALGAVNASAGWVRQGSGGGTSIVMPPGTSLTNVNASLLQGIPAAGFLRALSGAVSSNYLANGSVTARSLAPELYGWGSFGGSGRVLQADMSFSLEGLGESEFLVLRDSNLVLTKRRPSGCMVVYVVSATPDGSGDYNGPPVGTDWTNGIPFLGGYFFFPEHDWMIGLSPDNVFAHRDDPELAFEGTSTNLPGTFTAIAGSPARGSFVLDWADWSAGDLVTSIPFSMLGGGAPGCEAASNTFPILQLSLGAGWADFVLKASTNNFQSFCYFLTSTGTNKWTVDTNAWIYFTDDYRTNNPRVWNKLALGSNILGSVASRSNSTVMAAIVMPSHDAPNNWQEWMSPTNNNLIWSYARHNGVNWETNKTGTLTRWIPVLPTEWRQERIAP